MKKHITIFLFLTTFPVQLFAISQQSLKKYPHQLLSQDYGILNEFNLKKYTDGIFSKPFDWKISGLDYWQCFPTKNVSVWYKKGSYDPDEKVVRGNPHITIKASSLVHDYEPQGSYSLDYAKEKVTTWKRLMKNQKYVCIGGAFAGTYKKIENGQEIIEHGWIFENLKTKKGCDSYFSGWCN